MIRLLTLPHLFSAGLHVGIAAAVVMGGGTDHDRITHMTAIPIIFEDIPEFPYPAAPPPSPRFDREKQVPKEIEKPMQVRGISCPEPAAPPVFRSAQYEGVGLVNPLPLYPMVARKRGQEGTVILEVKVSDQGQVEGVSLSQSSGHEILDQVVCEVVRKWVLQPASRDQESVEDSLTISFHFKLGQPEPKVLG